MVSRESLGECADDPERLKIFDEEFERLAVRNGLPYLEERIATCAMVIRMWNKEAALRERELDQGAINPQRWQIAPGVMQRASRELDVLVERRIQLFDELTVAARVRVHERLAEFAPKWVPSQAAKAVQARVAAEAAKMAPAQHVPSDPTGPPSGATPPERAAASPA
jgi:hypothetical protein